MQNGFTKITSVAIFGNTCNVASVARPNKALKSSNNTYRSGKKINVKNSFYNNFITTAL